VLKVMERHMRVRVHVHKVHASVPYLSAGILSGSKVEQSDRMILESRCNKSSEVGQRGIGSGGKKERRPFKCGFPQRYNDQIGDS